jgi:hypothetical protein
MGPDILAPLTFFTFLTLVIVLPIFWRHRQYAAQLDVIAKALERGIDPERISLPQPGGEKDEDPNGNWKAGVLLVAIGLAIGLFFMLPMWLTGEFSSDSDAVPALAGPGLILSIGVTLLYIHRTIVGPVVKRGERRQRLDESGKVGELPG